MTTSPHHRNAVVLVDAEHHADAVRTALEQLDERGDHPVAVLYVGGSEKVDRPGEAPDLGYPAVWPSDPEGALAGLLREHSPDVVIDRTADPVVDDRRRQMFVAAVLGSNVVYEAPGTVYLPLDRPILAEPTSVAVIATGKRTGKTALSGAFTRHAARIGRKPCVVAMGRGGPAEPLLIPPRTELDVHTLSEIASTGTHAASDFYEDAVMTGAATIGCRRVGEGPTGAVGYSNVAEGMAALRELELDLAVLEGSGAAIPPAHADASMLIVPATADPRDLHAMLPLRFRLADLIVITMADPRLVARDQLATVASSLGEITAALSRFAPDRAPARTITTMFRPTPLGDVEGRRVFVATTAPETAGRAIADDLSAAGAEVTGMTHALSDRPRLREELDQAPAHDLLLTELKAAAVDVAAAAAAARGIETMFYDNRPVAIEPGADLDDAFEALIAAADKRQGQRLPFEPPT